MSTNFAHLSPWPALADAAQRAEAQVYADPRSACFYARRALELLVRWLYDTDSDFKRPYEDHLASLLAAPCFAQHVPPQITAKARVIKDLGNSAIHSTRPVRQYDALTAVRELFHITYWFARTYDRAFSAVDVQFDQTLIPPAPTDQAKAAQNTAEQIQKLEADLRARDDQLAAVREQRLTESARLQAELEAARREIAEAKRRAGLIPDPHDYSEAQTRDYFIDLMLREAGWPGAGKEWVNRENIEVQVEGMPNNEGVGYVDYVLWGDDGRPLGLVEAKRTKRDARIGQQQAKLYADCLEQRHGRRPIIFYTNGYETWLWDDVNYAPRPVQGFYTKDELELLIERRTSRLDLAQAMIEPSIVERYYQVESIRELAKHLSGGYRKGLVVMATGAGKTRTVIALVDLLQRCKWAKRVLFLADRTALVNQAVGAFKKHLPDSSPVNLVTERDKTSRVYVSTYPTMLNLIEAARQAGGQERRFGVGHFDLVIIDEAHRSVYQKYKAIFDYFDSMLVGLTATPRAEVDRDTYGLFDLQPGLPTYAYELDQAVMDGYLVPPRAVSVPLKIVREGLSYDDLPDEDKERWDALDWSEDGEVPEKVEPEAINKWLFNKDTVDKVLAQLMQDGLKVAGGDRLGKTILFAKNKDHARFIEERFNANYPSLKGSFARVIDHYEPYAQSLLNDFSNPDKSPHIAISVDMLDTGVDIPEVVNLVFFKIVRSKTKFFQMLGRGTRLRPDLFGPGKDKESFYVFDYCQNFEFFNQNPAGVEGNSPQSLGALLFLHRLELHQELPSEPQDASADGVVHLRDEIGDTLHHGVAAMNVENFLVRPKRRLVERFKERKAWDKLTPDEYAELGHQLTALPNELPAEDETAKRFDLLILRLQLAALNREHTFERLRDQVREIASRLAEKQDIPMVREQLPLILEVAGEEWWQNVTLPMLEVARKRLRDLVKFIDKAQRKLVISDFEDEIGVGQAVPIAGLQSAIDVASYRRKMERYLREHENHIAIRKLKTNEPLTALDLQELERLLFATSGVGTREDFERAYGPQESLGVFVRSLVGLDREAAKQAFSMYLTGSLLNADQIRFINKVVDDLTANGIMQPERLYESPYTDLNPNGLDGVFDDDDANKIISIINDINGNAGGGRALG